MAGLSFLASQLVGVDAFTPGMHAPAVRRAEREEAELQAALGF